MGVQTAGAYQVVKASVPEPAAPTRKRTGGRRKDRLPQYEQTDLLKEFGI